MSGSTITAVKAQLVALLTARPELASPVLVCYDEPGTNLPDDIVSVGDAQRQVTVATMIGSGAAGWLDETIDLEIVVDVYRGGDDPQGAFERAAALADIVADTVRSDPSLGGLVLRAVPDKVEYVSSFEAERKGRLARVITHLMVTARI